jgi:hypothetical protein
MINPLQSQSLYSVLQHYTGEKISSISVLGEHSLIFNTLMGDNGFVSEDLNGDWEIIIDSKTIYRIEKEVFEVLVKPSKKSSLEDYIEILNSIFMDDNISDRSRLLVSNILLFLEEYILNSEFIPRKEIRVGPFMVFNHNRKKFIYCLN